MLYYTTILTLHLNQKRRFMPTMIAEWEKQDLVMVVFPHENTDWVECLGEIQKAYMKFIETIARFQTCLVLCGDKKHEALFEKMHNIQTLHVDTNDTWIRDFGGIEVNIHGKRVTYDFTFNGWGGKYDSTLDNRVNGELFKSFGGTLVKKDFVLEGGSIDTNGKGALLTTASCIYNKNRNPNLTPKEIEEKLCEFFGIDEFICLENGFIVGDDTDSHVDILARFIDENTIAYHVCDDEDDEHFESLKKLEMELKQTKFKLLALPFPDKVIHKGRRLGASYVNFVFVNGGLIVPTYNQPKDFKVISILQNFLNKKIVGVDSRVFLHQNGSLHCASMNRFA